MLSKLVIGSAVSTAVAIADGSCNLYQVCSNHVDYTVGTYPDGDYATGGTCAGDGSDVTYPVFVDGGYPPEVMNTYGAGLMATACPFYDLSLPLCCNSDTAAIMVHNFQQLDGVFSTDCPICAANLKRMWCEYACSTERNDFLLDKGLSPPPIGDSHTQDFTNVQVTIDSAYACTVYTSCKQTSFIAAAGVSSAVGFLNFLGYNGAPYSLSYINFTQDLTESTAFLNSSAVPCETDMAPYNYTLYGYDNIDDSTCSFCQKVCPPPIVDDKIAFFDGFSWKLVGYSYLGFILFTLIFQVLKHCWINKKKLETARQAALANQTGSTAVGTSAQDSSRQTGRSTMGRQGRPLNMTSSDAGSDNRSGMLSRDESD